MSSSTDLPRPRSWWRPQFSLGTLFWLMLVAGMGAVWWKDRRKLEDRLQKLEQMYGPSQPLWSAADVLGPPDDLTGTAGKSWCPKGANAADWVEVGFDRAAVAATIDLYETYSVGCVTEVIAIDSSGREATIWKGTDPTPAGGRIGLFRVPVPGAVGPVKRVKIHVDSTSGASWACIDAVGLTTSGGKTTWATSSSASSVYGGGSLTASVENEPWFSLW